MFALPISICLFICHQILVASIPASIWIPVSPAACPISREHGKAPLTGQTRAHLGRPSPALQGADSLPEQHKGAPGGMREREKKSGGKFGTVGFRAELSQSRPPRGCSTRGAGTGAAPALLCGVSLFRFPPLPPRLPPGPEEQISGVCIFRAGGGPYARDAPDKISHHNHNQVCRGAGGRASLADKADNYGAQHVRSAFPNNYAELSKLEMRLVPATLRRPPGDRSREG